MRFLKQVRLVISMALLAVVGVACTPQNSETSKVSFVLPNVSTKASAQGGEVLHMVMIRITGVGMDQIAYNWDFENECRKIACNPQVNPPAAPNFVAFDVSKGQRLFQVLVVLKDSSERNILNYGDASKNLTADTESLRVDLQALGGAASEATVAGRYLTSSNSGPTGTLQMLLNPPTGSPAMEIQSSDIVSGYFSAMFLDNTKFTYKVKETGEVLFAEKTLADMTGLATSNSRLLISLPDFYRSGDKCRLESGRKLVAGYFGSIPSNAEICQEGTVTNVYSDAACSASMSLPTGTGGASTCSTNPAIPQIKLLRSQFGNGMDSILGYRGPFKMFLTANSYYDFIETSLSGTQATFSWAYIDGGQNAISGNDLFYSTASGLNLDIYDGMNGLDCRQISAASSMQVASLTPSTITHTINAGTALTAAVLCPYRTVGGVKQYLYSAIRSHSLGSGSGGSSSMGSISISGFTDFSTGVCQTGTVTLTPPAGGSLASGTLQIDGNGILQVSDTCGGSFSNSRSVGYSAGTAGVSLPVAVSISGTGIHRLWTNGTNLNSAGAMLVAPAPSGSVTGSKITFQDEATDAGVGGQIALVQGRCYPALLHALSGSQPIAVGTAGTAAIAFDPAGVVQTYSDPSCTVPQSNFVFTASQSNSMVYLKSSVSSGGTSMSLSGLPGSGQGFDAVVGPNSFSNFVFPSYVPTSFTSEQCISIPISAVNSVGASINPQSPTTYQFSAVPNTGVAYVNVGGGTCSGAAATNLAGSLSAYNSFDTIYVQAPSGATSIDLTLTSGAAVVKTKTLTYTP